MSIKWKCIVFESDTFLWHEIYTNALELQGKFRREKLC